MDLEKFKEIIVSTLLQIYYLIKNNKNVVGLIIFIIIVLIFTYFYSEKVRVSKKLTYINNALSYESPRLQLDFCGNSNNTVDKLLVTIKPYINPKDITKNGIQIIDNANILKGYNLSSEYVLEIKGKLNGKYDNLINKPYKIKNIYGNILYFSNDTQFPANKPLKTTSVGGGTNVSEELVELTFYKINPESRQNPYKYKRLCEYYISSSCNSFLVGNQMFDYVSVDIMKKALYFGARYIEIPIYDKELRNDTIPVIFHGFGNNQLTFNYVTVEAALEAIGIHAFNKRYLDNANDPLFLFLDIKTKNINTLDKVYDIFIKYLRKYLLPPSYNHINIAQSKICELAGKCVILSSDGYKGSKLDELINCSTNSGYLKRITYNEALLNKAEMMGPMLKLDSNKIKFVSTNISDSHLAKTHFRDHIEIVDKNINLFNYGITKGDGVYISGSKNASNNSGEYMFPIDTITKNKIVFNKDVFLKNETIGDYITIEIYDKHSKFEELEEYNKNKLTIVIPDAKNISSNYNFKNIMYKGCQFVCMNFHNPDTHMKEYFNLFAKQSYIFKPKVLINSMSVPKSVSINSMVPIFKSDVVLDINYDFMNSLRNNRNATIIPFKNDKLKLIVDGRTVKFSLDHNVNNSKIEIVPPLNDKTGYVSFKYINGNDTRYLTFQEACCYLYFTKRPELNNNDISKNTHYKFNDSASFISLNTPISKPGYNSFGVVKTKNDKEKLYYLKIRSSFNSNRKLFYRDVYEYEVKFHIKNTSANGATANNGVTGASANNGATANDIIVFKPKYNSGFLPVGDIVMKYDDDIKDVSVNNEDVITPYQTFNTKIFSGAVDKPIDYELIWEGNINSGDDEEEMSIWKPIPNDGFIEMGHVFVKGTKKPSINDVVCVSVDYVKEEYIKTIDRNSEEYDNYEEPLYFDEDKQLALWNISNHNYAKAYPFVKLYQQEQQDSGESDIYVESQILIPNIVEFKMYDFILEDKDYLDRLYLDTNLSTKDERESTLFKISFDSIVESSGNEVYDYLMKIENSNGKLLSYTPNEAGNKMCMGLPQPYWSSFYEDVSKSGSVTKSVGGVTTSVGALDPLQNKIKFESCKGRDYFGTNWNIYEDNTVRLEGNPNACLTYNGDPESSVSVDINDENNYLFLDKCVNDNSKNQKFEFVDNNIRVLTGTNYDPNACLTHTPDDRMRLEECGDKKFTVVSKWNGKIASIDKCNRVEAEEEMKKIGSMEICNDLSYYVVFLDRGINHRHEEYCSYEDAEEVYEAEKDNYPRGIAIVNGNKILVKKVGAEEGNMVLKNYMIQLLNVEGDCRECSYPSKILCVENSIEDSEYNHFENDKEKREISEHCRKLKNKDNFRCSRGFRQKFKNNIRPRNYCIDYNKAVYLYVYSDDQYPTMEIDVSRNSNLSEGDNNLVDNLLGETYDTDNYHMFIKGIVKKSTDNNKFKIVFDANFVQGINLNSVELFKYSNDIILAYTPSYDEVEIGTKVLAKLGYQPSENVIDKRNIDSSNQYHYEYNNFKIKGSHVKWMAVVINKLKNDEVEVMFSINSYDIINNTDSGRPYSNTNIRKIYNVEDLILLSKAPLCI